MKTISCNNCWYWVEKTGTVLVTVSVLVFLLTFYPVVKEEIRYQFFPKHLNATVETREASAEKGMRVPSSENDTLYPIDENFGIVIPKITANAKVIPDVDWQNSAQYQRALTEGVAHAQGTSHPGEKGNIFIFAHSGVDFYEAIRYNAQFYLLSKLVAGDEIDLFYKKQKYVYVVARKEVVLPENVEHIMGQQDKNTLTLMTCTPAGTTFKRLIIIANQVGSN